MRFNRKAIPLPLTSTWLIAGVIALCLSFSKVSVAQNLKKANEISQQLAVETDHFKKAELLLKLSEVEGVEQMEMALEHADRALTIFENIQNKEGQIRAFLALGKLELTIGNDPVARSYFNKGYMLSEEIGDMKSKIRSKIYLGQSYQDARDEFVGQEHLQDAVEIAKSIKGEEQHRPKQNWGHG